MAKPNVKQILDLPKGILAKDLEYPKYSAKAPRVLYDKGFELWAIENRINPKRVDWVIPTLLIQNPGRRAMPGVERRTYAIAVADSSICRVGMGPHVKATCTVYVTEANVDRLQPFIDLHAKGMADATQIRDRISTRRAVGALRRSQFGW